LLSIWKDQINSEKESAMKKTHRQISFFVTLLFLGAMIVMLVPFGALSQETANSSGKTFSEAELDQMLASIALYPDSLLAQILLAATFSDQIKEADRWVKHNPDLKGEALNNAVTTMDWDLSVKALAPFPQVLDMMAQESSWTERLGDAFVNQQADVIASIQRLRSKAYQAGNLKSTSQQTVEVKGEDVVIEPAQPEVVYVPRYNPVAVYGAWAWPGFPPVVYAPVFAADLAVEAVDVGVGALVGAAVAVDAGIGFLGGIEVGPAFDFGWGTWGWGGGGGFGVNVDRNVNINSNTNINNNFNANNNFNNNNGANLARGNNAAQAAHAAGNLGQGGGTWNHPANGTGGAVAGGRRMTGNLGHGAGGGYVQPNNNQGNKPGPGNAGWNPPTTGPGYVPPNTNQAKNPAPANAGRMPPARAAGLEPAKTTQAKNPGPGNPAGKTAVNGHNQGPATAGQGGLGAGGGARPSAQSLEHSLAQTRGGGNGAAGSRASAGNRASMSNRTGGGGRASMGNRAGAGNGVGGSRSSMGNLASADNRAGGGDRASMGNRAGAGNRVGGSRSSMGNLASAGNRAGGGRASMGNRASAGNRVGGMRSGGGMRVGGGAVRRK
jgi:hypothetical protein